MAAISTSVVFTKTRKANTRVIVHEGSSRSTKTYSIIQYLIFKCLESPNTTVTVCRSRLTWVKKTVYRDFLAILRDHYAIYNPNSLNKTDLIYTFDNGSTFEFMGLDDPGKAHGFKGQYLWINEATQVSQVSYTQLAIRTTKQIILDYNPGVEQHWIYDSVIPREDCTFIHSTYNDNPFLEQAVIDEIERLEPTPENIEKGTADAVSWKIYGLGIRAAHRGLIFKDIKICPVLPARDTWKKVFYGLDFGFTNDPTTLTMVVLSQGTVYIKQLIYERGLVNRRDPLKPNQKSIEQRFIDLGIPFDAVIWADSAEPKSIKELQNAGWYCLNGAAKGPDSIVNGIQLIQKHRCLITEDSLDIIKERDNYKWREDKEGKILNKPIDNWNHSWDGIRMIFLEEFNAEYTDDQKAYDPKEDNKAKNIKTIEDKLNYLKKRARHESNFS